MLYIDTNIFLEFLLEQEKSEDCKNFLHWAEKQRVPLVCSQFSIHAIEANMSHVRKEKMLKKFLENITLAGNITVYQTTLEEEIQIAALMQQKNLDFDDALQYFVAKKTGCSAIVSFDAHFDKTGLPRKTPADFLVL